MKKPKTAGIVNIARNLNDSDKPLSNCFPFICVNTGNSTPLKPSSAVIDVINPNAAL